MAEKEQRFSFSKISCFEGCGMKYKLKYVDGNYVGGSSIAFEFGTLTHGTEEEIANCIKDGREIDYVKLKNNYIKKLAELEHKYAKDFFAEDKSGRTYRQKAYEYLESGIYRLATFLAEHPSVKIVGAEIPIDYLYKDKYRFSGSIDRMLYDEETGTYIIQDIKTYNLPIEKDKLRVPLQLIVYSLATAEEQGVDLSKIKVQYDLPLCQMTQDAGTDIDYIEKGKAKLDELFAGVESKQFFPNSTALCHWCEYCPTNESAPEDGKRLCPFYIKWTKENHTFAKDELTESWQKENVATEKYTTKRAPDVEKTRYVWTLDQIQEFTDIYQKHYGSWKPKDELGRIIKNKEADEGGK